MRHAFLRHLALSLFVVMLLGACHGRDNDSQPGGRTPEAAVQSSVNLLKAGNFSGFWKHALPPADYATLRADWQRHQQSQPAVTAQDRARFSATMQQLTAPGAQARLYAELQPKLTRMQQQYQDQLPVLLKVGEALLKNRVAQNPQLTAAQKAQASSVLDVLGPWAQQAPWFDLARAKQAIGVTVATARTLALQSPDQLRAMDFDTAMGKYAQGFAGLRQLLAIYGLSIDDALNSVRLTQLSRSHGHAVVKIDYSLLGKPLSTESSLVEQDGRWYSEDLLNHLRASAQAPGAPAGSASAAAAASVATATVAAVPGPVAGTPPAARSVAAKD